MLKLVITFLVLIICLSFLFGILYQNLPGEPENFEKISGQKTKEPEVTYGKVPMFLPNLRFDHTDISYFIENSCSTERKERMSEAFIIVGEKTGILSFKEEETEADILVGCSENYLELEENMFVAGHGGPTKILNTSLFNIIIEGKISLYRETHCDDPTVEIHELLHVFGFDHSSDPKNIMYNFSSCDQKISQDTIDTLISLYKIKPLPELLTSNVSAVKRGRYLDFEITIQNIGLSSAENFNLSVYSSEKKIEAIYFDELEAGVSKILTAKNIRLPSRTSDQIKFIIDEEDKVNELDKGNNEIELTVN